MWRNSSGLVVAFLVAALSACGGGDTVSTTDGASGGSGTVGGETWSVADVAPSVEFFGDLAVVRSAPVTTTFDASAASLELDDSVIVDVPAGAFEAPTEVTAVIVDLDFAQYADGAPPAIAYVLSTDADVDLAAPVVLEVPEPPDAVSVLQPIDGEWRLVEVPSGATTRIPITHLSEVPTVVAMPGISNAVIKGSDPDGEAPGDFLTACLYTVTLLLADDTGVAGEQDTSLSLQLAYSFCTRALVTKFSPSGVRVEVSCVGDKIGGDVDFLAAIDACAEETDSTPTESDPETTTEPPGDVGGQPGTGSGSEQGQVTEGRYVGSLDDAGSILDVEVGGNSMEVVVEGESVTEFSLEVSGRYSACFGGYGVDDEVSCTVWLTWDAALSDGPVAISEGSADVPLTSTTGYTDCESELASECKDWDYTEVEAATARISFTAETMTGSFLFEGQDLGTSFTATRL